MNHKALKFVYGMFLASIVFYYLACTNVVVFLEGLNPDGSSSLTWRSDIACFVLFVICELVAFWAFRRCIQWTIGIAVGASFPSWIWLIFSKYGFEWEPHQTDGTFSPTWRTNIAVMVFLSIFLGLAFLGRLAIIYFKRHRIAAE